MWESYIFMIDAFWDCCIFVIDAFWASTLVGPLDGWLTTAFEDKCPLMHSTWSENYAFAFEKDNLSIGTFENGSLSFEQ